jgi:hypothetical protein
MQTKSLVGLTALMLAAFAVLTGLGVWQLQRLEWKQGLIAQIEARTNGPPITLEDAVALAGEGRDPSYYRVGRWPFPPRQGAVSLRRLERGLHSHRAPRPKMRGPCRPRSA